MTRSIQKPPFSSPISNKSAQKRDIRQVLTPLSGNVNLSMSLPMPASAERPTKMAKGESAYHLYSPVLATATGAENSAFRQQK
jgi:hypothetical protein